MSNIIKFCEICKRVTFLDRERAWEGEFTEGNVCGRCSRWVCTECTNFGLDEGNEGELYCVECMSRSIREYISCPKNKGLMRPVEVCYSVCKYYNRCHVIHNEYTRAGYKLVKKNGKQKP